MSDSDRGGSTIGSAIGSMYAGLLQVQLMNNEKFISSVKAMHLSSLRLSASALQFSIKHDPDAGRATSIYAKDLFFEGQRVTPAARDYLLDRCMKAANYDEINAFTKRLVWWILDNKPYENHIIPPQPPVISTPIVDAGNHLNIGFAIAAIIVIVFAVVKHLFIVVPMGLVLAATYLISTRRIEQPDVEPEWAWLQQYS